MPPKMIRQGDLVLVRVGDAETAEKPTAVKLAIGEDSGHAHVLDVVKIADRLVDVPQPSQLRVEPDHLAWRHQPIPVPPGRYQYVIQQEYVPAGARQVQD